MTALAAPTGTHRRVERGQKGTTGSRVEVGCVEDEADCVSRLGKSHWGPKFERSSGITIARIEANKIKLNFRHVCPNAFIDTR